MARWYERPAVRRRRPFIGTRSIDHGLKAVGATATLLLDPARALLVRTSRGVPRVAARLLRAALRVAHERNQSFVDETVMEQAVVELTGGAGPVPEYGGL